MSKFITAEGREYEISLAEVTNREAQLLQELTGKRYVELVDDLGLYGPDGKAAFLWLAMRKSGHHVEFDTLEFPMGLTRFVQDEPDPTQASPGTPTDESTSLTSTSSTTGPPSTPKSNPTSLIA